MRIPSLIAPMLLLLTGCDGPAPPPIPAAVPDTQHLQLVPDPGGPAPETPPTATLWRRGEAGWQPDGRVMAVAPGGRVVVSARRELLVDGTVRLTDVLPDVRVQRGTVFASRSVQRPDSDIWRVDPDGTAHRLTHDGRSDRPFPLPDGRLLWVSGAGGMAGFVLDGTRLTNRPGDAFVPVPARHAPSRLRGEHFIYDAGDGEWSLNLRTGKAGPR